MQRLTKPLFWLSLATVLLLILRPLLGIEYALHPRADLILITGAVGYLTNWLAILMLFRPYEPKAWLPLWPQGIIPRSKGDIANSVGRQVAAELLTPKDISEELCLAMGSILDDAQARRELRFVIGPMLRDQMPQSAKVLAPKLMSLLRSGSSTIFQPDLLLEFLQRTLKPWLESPKNRQDLLNWISPLLKEEAIPAIMSRIDGYIEDQKQQGTFKRFFVKMGELVGAIDADQMRVSLVELFDSPAFRDDLCRYIAALPLRIRNALADRADQRIEKVIRQLQLRASDAMACVLPGFLAGELPRIINEILDQNEIWDWVADDLLPMMKPHLTAYVSSERFHKVLNDHLDVAKRIEVSIAAMDVRRLHRMVLEVTDRQLAAIQVLGYALGGAAGLML